MSSKRRHSMHKQVLGTSKRELEVSEGVYCRTCLVTDNLMSIFYGSDDEEKVSHNLKIVTGLEIKYNDGLSQKMCVKCLNTFNKALQFRRTCKKAEKTLLGLLSPKKKYDQPKLKKPKVEHEYSYEAINYDDFQNDEQFDSKDDVKPILVKKERKPQNARQKAIKIPNASSYKCGTCNKEFKMKATYKAHMRFHTNYCVCESCGKRCRNNHQLQEHKRARHGLGRIHKCAYCDYSSATKEALVIHERRHTGERPYICDHCGATFHRRSNLVQHIAIHLPDKNFQCDMCPKRLKSRKFLQIHKHNAHTGRRYGYLCAVCHHRFDKPNKVRAHARRVHGLADTQQGPVQRCTFCPTREKSKKRLQIHISKAHRVKRFSYKCPCCSKLFQRSEHTHRHLTRVHHIPRDIHPPIEKIHTHYCNSDCTALTCSNYCDVTPTATDMCQNVV